MDYNRAGVGLIEIVTLPDISSSTEAAHFIGSLRQLLRDIDVCDGNMDEVSFPIFYYYE